jgi:phenylpropionate dioxygenase-like ring-hydroxylating dioxygenase large terminal subunit
MESKTSEEGPFDEHAFRREQKALAHTWTLLGVTGELENDNDWLRGRLGGRSVFVQRFGSEIVGFENVCPHRGYPLRAAGRGSGPIICGFHGWHFDRQGRAVGIPICTDVFGATPHDVAARLGPIDVALCGSLVFGRLAPAKPSESLEQFLGDGGAILAAISTSPPTLHRFEQMVEANWRLMMSITLDDYHSVAVHRQPTHFKTSNLHYWRFGPHSALTAAGGETLQSVAEQCRAGRYRPTNYMILNIFPNLAVSLFNAHPYWYAQVQQFVPVSPSRTKWRGWFFPTNFPTANLSALRRAFRPLTELIRARVVRYSLEKVGNQDHAACERLQEVAHQFTQPPILGSQETRVGWFLESYAQRVGGRLSP